MNERFFAKPDLSGGLGAHRPRHRENEPRSTVRRLSTGSHRSLGTGGVALFSALAIGALQPNNAHAQTPVVDQTASGLIKCNPTKAARTSTLPQVQIHPRAKAGLALPYGGTPINVTTFHYDNSRTGWNSSETDLTPSSVASENFGLLASIPIFGAAWAQPLLVSGYTMPNGSVHDVLIVATTRNMVYAFDARSYAKLWSVSLGPWVSQLPPVCRQQPGVNSTPVVGPGAIPGQMVLYLAGNVQPSPGAYRTQVRALDLGSGRDVQAPTYLAASRTLPNGTVVSYDPSHQFNRSGLALNNGKLYIAVASDCETQSYSTVGWIFKVSTDFSTQTAISTISRQTTTQLMDGIWMTGFAPAIDAAGNLFVTTGNGDATTQAPQDWGSSVIKLAPDLSAVTDSFTPADYAILARRDGDFSSGGVMLLPPVPGQVSDPLAVAMGKDPILYLLDQTALGGYSSTNSGAMQALTLGVKPSTGVWGGPAFYNGPAGPVIFYQKTDDVLTAYHVSTGAKPSLSLMAQGTSLSSNGGSIPVVSSNGSAPNTGIVWLVRRSSPPALEAYDATELGEPIFQASIGTDYSIYHGPMVANGRAYVGSSGRVYVFGLTAD